jgi:hypothetical protein
MTDHGFDGANSATLLRRAGSCKHPLERLDFSVVTSYGTCTVRLK